MLKSYNNYKKQRKFSPKLYKKERIKFYKNLNIQDITDNKKFLKKVKSLLSDKRTCGSSKINLVVGEESLSDDKEIAENFNNYFNNVMESLNLQPEHLNMVSYKNDPIQIAILSLKIILAM